MNPFVDVLSLIVFFAVIYYSHKYMARFVMRKCQSWIEDPRAREHFGLIPLPFIVHLVIFHIAAILGVLALYPIVLLQ